MYHRLQFRASYRLDLQVSRSARPEQILIRQGEIFEAQVRPYVKETLAGPVEMADLQLPGDGTLLAVPMASFSFI